MVTIPKKLQAPKPAKTVSQLRAGRSVATQRETVQKTTTPTAPSLTSQERAEVLANTWVNRKLRGQRIVTAYYGQKGYSAADYALAKQLYLQARRDPTLRRQLSRVAEAKSRAQELGFDNLQEYGVVTTGSIRAAERAQQENINISTAYPNTIDASRPQTTRVKPDDGTVYIPLEEIEAAGGAVPGSQPQRFTPPPEPIYISSEEIDAKGGVQPGRQPLRLSPEIRQQVEQEQAFTLGPTRDNQFVKTSSYPVSKTATYNTPQKEKPSREFQPGSLFLGDSEIVFSLQKNYGTPVRTDYSNIGSDEVIVARPKTISPDYSAGIKRRATEFLGDGAGAALTIQNEQLYLPTSKEANKFRDLLLRKDKLAGKATREFLREQQAQLKRDLGRYNQLRIKSNTEEGLTENEYNESIKLRNRINQGQRGTVGDVIYTATEELTARGERLGSESSGISISPRTARRGLISGTAAYDVLTDILIYQVAAGGVSSVLSGSSAGRTFLSGVNTASKFLRPLTPVTGLSIGGVKGFGEYRKRGDVGDAIAAGIGGTGGFFSGVYSKQIVEGVSKGFLKIAGPQKKGKFSSGRMSKKGALATQQTSKGDEIVEVVDSSGQVRYMTKSEALARGLKIQRVLSAGQAKRILIQTADKETVKRFIKSAFRDIDKAYKAGELSLSQRNNEIKKVFSSLEKLRPELLSEFKTTVYEFGAPKPKPTKVSGGRGRQPGEGRNVILGGQTQGTYQVTDVSQIYRTPPGMPGPQPLGKISGTELLFGQQSSLATQQAQLLDSQSQTKLLTDIGVGLGLFSGVKSRYDSRTVEALDFKIAPAYATMNDTQTANDTQTDSVVSSVSRSTIETSTSPSTATTPATTTTTTTTTQTGLQTGLGQQGSGRSGTPRRPRPEPPKPINILIPQIRFRRGGRDNLMDAYSAQVKVGKKFVPVDKKSYTFSGAQDAVAKTLDNTTSATGKVVKKKKKVRRSKLNAGEGYYSSNKKKFRGFKVVRGKRVALSNTLIERKQYRSDTPGEKKGLTVAQFTSRTRKRAAGLPTRKKKGQKRRTPFGF